MRVGFGLFALGLMSAFSLVGCSGGSAPPETLVLVAGTLLVDGKPLDGVIVTFIPEIAKNNRGGSGTTAVDGGFTITDLTQNLPGLAAGRYTVSYSRRRLPDGSAPPETVPGQEVDPGIILVETLPTHLQSPDPRAPFNQVVIPEGGIVDLALSIRTK